MSCRPYHVLLLSAALTFGCDTRQRRAEERVINALNDKVVSVALSQCAVLKRTNGFAALEFTEVGVTSRCEVFLSSSGDFKRERTTLGVHTGHNIKLNVQGSTLIVRYDGENASAVALQLEDVTSGIAVSAKPGLDAIDVTALHYATNATFTPSDLAEALRLKK